MCARTHLTAGQNCLRIYVKQGMLLLSQRVSHTHRGRRVGKVNDEFTIIMTLLCSDNQAVFRISITLESNNTNPIKQ